ncbi:hypothetical protein [Cognatiyoonia sp. IB215182]|uniref:hypothetical protein n=1 Tax=Cognatiyoonia sp. IB215182 TaxID=3097353 RepID=UPI002A0AB1EF|nr:hypothetical protein [Cognatiyoonia sp. IB215182]MDX8351190.1 hypothetical protein [Cognatiyoonia sp. IB215182]
MSASEILLAIITAGGGGAIVAFAAFRFLAVSWLEQKFTQQLEANRHENAKELQALSASIEGSLSKTLKSQEKEFEVLSELWRLANVAFGLTAEFTKPGHSYPDPRKLSEQRFREVLEDYGFRPVHAEEIIASPESDRALIEAMFWTRRNKASSAQTDFQNYLYLNEVFVEEQTFTEFESISKGLKEVILSHELEHESFDPKSPATSNEKVQEEIRPRLEEIAPTLRKKFFERL